MKLGGMVSPRKRRLVRDESDTDSDAEVVVSWEKRRRIICAEDDDDAQFSTVGSAAPNKTDAALLQSLNASQRPSPSLLPTLPSEILLTILEHVPAAYILDLRLVNSSFRTAVDMRVFYRHIKQVELVGYLGHYNDEDDDLMWELSPDDYWRFALVRAHFAGLDGWEPGQARWEPKRAKFRPMNDWIDTLHGIGGEMQPVNPWWDHVLGRLDLEFPPQVYSQLRWCVKVGGLALDIGIPDGLGKDTNIQILVDDKGVVFRVTDWKVLLWNLFSEERALNVLLEEVCFALEEQSTGFHPPTPH